MHILIIPSWYPKDPGDINGCFFREQAISLKKNEHHIGVVYPQFRSIRDWRSLFAGEYGLQTESDELLHVYRWHGMAWSLRMPFSGIKLWLNSGLKLYESYIKQHGKPDIIHAHSLLNAGVLASEIKKRHNIPFVITEHSSAYGKGLITPLLRQYARDAAIYADARLAVSMPFAKLLERFFSMDAGTWKVLPNILSSRFEAASLTEVTVNRKPFVFVNISMLSPIKGIDVLLQGFAKFSKADGDTRLLIGGEGRQKQSLESMAEKLGIATQVDFLGSLSRDQVVSAMLNSHAYVLSSHSETFGVAVIESLALGKPVIATRCGGPESIVQVEDGLVIPADDVNALAAAMDSIKNNYDDYKGEEIRRSCISRYGERAVVKQLNAVYEKVLANHTVASNEC